MRSELAHYIVSSCGAAAACFGNDRAAGNLLPWAVQSPGSMQDLSAKLEKLLSEAEDCELVARLATDLRKRAHFARLAVDLRRMAHEIQTTIKLRKPNGP